VKCRSRTGSLAIYSYWMAHALAQKWLNEKWQTWLATIVSQKVTRVTSHFLYYSMCLKSFSNANASGKRWHHSQTAGSATCISQGSVATVLKWGDQKYSNLHQVFFDFARQKLLKSANAAWSVSKNKSGTLFYGPWCIFASVVIFNYILMIY